MAVPVFKMLVPVEIMPWTVNVDLKGKGTDFFAWTTQFVQIGDTIKTTRWEIIAAIMAILGLLNVARELLSYYCFMNNVRKLPELANEEIRGIVDNTVADYGRKTNIQLKRTNVVTAPSIVGLVKPIILIPDRLMEDLNLEGVLQHEIAHYMCGDIWIKFVWFLVKAFSFWNPVLYILDGQLVKVLEIRADEKAVKDMSDDKRHEYRAVLACLANRAGKQKKNRYGVAFLHKRGMLVKKRIDLLEHKYQRTRKDLIANYVAMFLGAVGLFILMNCFILEPVTQAPIEDYEGTKMVTGDSCFFVKNADGTYDMYMDGIYCVTLEGPFGSEITVYESLEEVNKHETDN